MKVSIRNKNPKILLVDDQANLGWSGLLKKVIYHNVNDLDFQIHQPLKTDFQDDASFNKLFLILSNKIYNKGMIVDLLLLDLRLADEVGAINNLDELSGIKLLKKIHITYPALTIIILTASNKAASVMKIIDCGAFGFWTKPGLLDLKDDIYYLDSYKELLKLIDNALKRYKTSIDKNIIISQFQVERLRDRFVPDFLKNINIILTDTTFWCDCTSNLIRNHKSARKLIYYARICKFVVLDDVINELFIHTIRTDSSLELKKSAQYGLNAIIRYKQMSKITTGYEDVKEALHKATSYSIESPSSDEYFVVSNVKKIHSFHTSELSAITDIKTRIGHEALHADDTFQMLIPYYIEEGKNVMLVSDDFRTNASHIVNTLKNKFDIEFEFEFPECFNKQKHVLKVKINNNYCLILNSQVLYRILFVDNFNLDACIVEI